MWPFLIFLFLNSWSSAQALELKGTARAANSQKILYSEKHSIVLDQYGLNKKIVSEYLKPDGQVFAKMTSDFSKNKTVPSISFFDSRFKKQEELSFLSDEKSILLRTTTEAKSEEKKFPLKDNMVVGQGFDNFIKLNFKKLPADPISILFGVVGKLDFFSFTAQKKGTPSAARVTFGLSVSNIFLRVFVDELKVDYDLKTKQLVRYSGLSNIPDDQGNEQNVVIDYDPISAAASSENN